MHHCAVGFLPHVRIAAVSGSLKRESLNSTLLRAIADESTDDVRIWDRLGELPHFSPDLEGNEAVASLRELVAASDAVVIATPEYAGGMPGSLKNALDWLVGSGELYDKPVAVVSAAPSAERGVNARRWVEEVLGMQGAHVVASFTVAMHADAAGEWPEQAGEARRRITDALAISSRS
jgi:chromate reductase, NAD(P)H dehydrogenase (quinone)